MHLKRGCYTITSYGFGYLCVKNVETSDSCPLSIIFFVIRSWNKQWSGKNKTQQLSARVSVLTEIKINDNWGKCRTDDKGIKGVRVIVPDLRTQDVDPSAKVTLEVDVFDWKVEKRLELPVTWSVAPESMTHLEDEEIRQVFDLPDSAMVGTWVDEDFKDSWY